jgi:hypothetical protein
MMTVEQQPLQQRDDEMTKRKTKNCGPREKGENGKRGPSMMPTTLRPFSPTFSISLIVGWRKGSDRQAFPLP